MSSMGEPKNPSGESATALTATSAVKGWNLKLTEIDSSVDQEKRLFSIRLLDKNFTVTVIQNDGNDQIDEWLIARRTALEDRRNQRAVVFLHVDKDASLSLCCGSHILVIYAPASKTQLRRLHDFLLNPNIMIVCRNCMELDVFDGFDVQDNANYLFPLFVRRYYRIIVTARSLNRASGGAHLMDVQFRYLIDPVDGPVPKIYEERYGNFGGMVREVWSRFDEVLEIDMDAEEKLMCYALFGLPPPKLPEMYEFPRASRLVDIPREIVQCLAVKSSLGFMMVKVMGGGDEIFNSEDDETRSSEEDESFKDSKAEKSALHRRPRRRGGRRLSRGGGWLLFVRFTKLGRFFANSRSTKMRGLGGEHSMTSGEQSATIGASILAI